MSKIEISDFENWVLIGEGTFAKVYRVTWRETGAFLCCKVLTRRDLADQEGAFLTLVRHPLFPRFLGVFHQGEEHCLVMEHIEGCNLREFVTKRGCLSQRKTAEIAKELAEGLLFLHELSEPVIFRDLKPENVIIQQDGRVRLIDLGCACFLQEAALSRAGTRGYAAPEQLSGNPSTGVKAAEEGGAGIASDVYGLGKLMAYMLTGQENWEMPKRKNRKRAWGENVSAGFFRLLLSMTRESQKLRVPDMHIFLRRLAPYVGEGRKKFALFKGIKDHRREKETAFFYERDVWRGL